MSEKEKDCKNCEYCKKVVEGAKEFVFKALIIYVGVTLAIITSANILKPKHHCPFAGPYPRMERPFPGPMMHHGYFNGMKHFKGPRGEFKKFNRENPEIPGAAPELKK